ncbi:MAG: methionine ABC transporter ATP-binding protein [Clostridiales bacterium]|nr:methionine ABC transporter ATP-binding protein [Clostridiales bacterium]MDY4181093.1 methionine ABC transporter ATP-binding protein [Pseudoflavonifractor sp.]
MIEIRHLQKSFGSNEVLKNIDITIRDGEIYGLIGVSGAGKSTLLRCINGLEPYDGGSLKIDGVEVSQLNKQEMRRFRSNIGMIFQQFLLMDRMTVYQNIALPMKCWKRSSAEIDRRVSELLSLVELSDKKNARPRELSGGQKQRVAIARALAMEPRILLCDEATSALDPNITISILELLKKINRELGLTIIVVTHQMDVVKQICSRVSVLSHGVLTCTGEVKDIFLKQPQVLSELLSEASSQSLPAGGVNVEIIYPMDTASTLLSRMALETGIAYELVRDRVETYCTGTYGCCTIHIAGHELAALEVFLKRAQVEWRVLQDVL